MRCCGIVSYQRLKGVVHGEGYAAHGGKRWHLKPHVGYAFTVSRQVFEFVESVKVVNRNSGDWPGLRQAKVHSNTSLSVRRELLASPVGNTSTGWTKVELHAFAANVRIGTSRD